MVTRVIPIEGEYVKHSDLSVTIKVDDDRLVSLPLSKLNEFDFNLDDLHEGQKIELGVPEWLAIDRRLI